MLNSVHMLGSYWKLAYFEENGYSFEKSLSFMKNKSQHFALNQEKKSLSDPFLNFIYRKLKFSFACQENEKQE